MEPPQIPIVAKTTAASLPNNIVVRSMPSFRTSKPIMLAKGIETFGVPSASPSTDGPP
jgi:hypothetical protein